MKYFSTRDNKLSLSSKEAILKGISEDGGLFVPESFPNLNIEEFLNLSYEELAYEVLKLYLTDYDEGELKTAINHAYSKNFIEGVAPVRKVGGTYYLELYHGPTLAFKDFALMLLPKLMEQAKESLGDNSKTLILTATSGDTGKAALQGFSDLNGIDIVVFYPKSGVSKIQELQMVTTPAKNTSVVAVKGNFDDAQTGVKELFNSKEFNAELKQKNIKLSSANSINIGRLLPQIVYYFYAYGKLRTMGEINVGDRVSFSVPTGNFGDVLAGYYAKRMGLPVEKLIVASNENKVLTEFFNMGVYDSNRELKVTNSPSMDIIISSNLERLLYHNLNSSDRIIEIQNDLKNIGKFNLDTHFEEFCGDYCTEHNTLLTIDTVYNEDSYLIDTHTAVAKYVGEKCRKSIPNSKLVVLSTASPFKFPRSVGCALGVCDTEDEFDDLDRLSELSSIKIPQSLIDLKTAKIIHDTVIEKGEMKNTILRLVGDVSE